MSLPSRKWNQSETYKKVGVTKVACSNCVPNITYEATVGFRPEIVFQFYNTCFLEIVFPRNISKRIITNPIEEVIEGVRSLSACHYGFRKERSIIDALLVVVYTVGTLIKGRDTGYFPDGALKYYTKGGTKIHL